MLKLHFTTTRGNILREDLTEEATTFRKVAPYYTELQKLAVETHGWGLSANQVGLRMNFFYVDASVNLLRARKPSPHTCVNPCWVPHENSESVECRESCASLPGREFLVNRESKIRAAWTDTAGNRVKRILNHIHAQIFQHECDHLKGITLEQSTHEEL